MDNIMKEIIKTVKQCGQLILNADRTTMAIDAKEGPANFVTEYDKKRLLGPPIALTGPSGCPIF